MRSYRFSYTVQSSFVPPINWHFFKLRAIPCDNEFQHVEVERFEVSPESHLVSTCDGFGNAVQYGSIDSKHDTFSVVSEGFVTQYKTYEIAEIPAPFYLAFTHLTECNEEMKAKAEELGSPLDIMHFVHDRISYMPLSTTVATTAKEVFRDKRGVCQDFAHLMIAMCRAIGFLARYANGLIIGEGETHAWVEVWDGKVWKAYDPTHDLLVEWDYIKIAHGRDADDCPTNRGRIYAWTSETMTVSCKLIRQ